MELDTVYHMDAIELINSLPDASIDAVITDPPYGLAGRVFKVESIGYTAVNEEWDAFAPVDWLAPVSRVLKPGGSVICFGVRQSIYALAAEGLRLGWRLVNDITWYKPDAMPNMTGRMMTESTERILWFCPSGTQWTYNLKAAKSMNGGQNLRDVWTFGRTRDQRYHPTQKPLILMRRIVELLTNEGDVVLDPFMGSGTTLVAARNTGRRYIGCDINPDYVAVARRRLSQPFTPDMFATIERQAQGAD